MEIIFTVNAGYNELASKCVENNTKEDYFFDNNDYSSDELYIINPDYRRKKALAEFFEYENEKRILLAHNPNKIHDEFYVLCMSIMYSMRYQNVDDLAAELIYWYKKFCENGNLHYNHFDVSYGDLYRISEEVFQKDHWKTNKFIKPVKYPNPKHFFGLTMEIAKLDMFIPWDWKFIEENYVPVFGSKINHETMVKLKPEHYMSLGDFEITLLEHGFYLSNIKEIPSYDKKTYNKIESEYDKSMKFHENCHNMEITPIKLKMFLNTKIRKEHTKSFDKKIKEARRNQKKHDLVDDKKTEEVQQYAKKQACLSANKIKKIELMRKLYDPTLTAKQNAENMGVSLRTFMTFKNTL